MRDSKLAFSPVVIKQEPNDPADQDTTTNDNNNSCNNNNNNNNSHHHEDSAVDLRSGQRISAMTGRRGGVGGASDCHSATYESTEEFVAQIARRVREESSLRGLELTPVTGLGPLADLKASAIPPIFTGPSSVEGGGKSRGEYACAECSSRFDTARDFRAHCLTHQVLKAESRLRSSRGVELDGHDGEDDSPGTVFGGLGSAVDSAVTFTCEDCDTRFSSRDTYAMHMLIRAKNEACFPGHALPTPTSNAPTAITATNCKDRADSSSNSNGSNHPPLSPASSLTAATPLPSSALLLARTTPPDLKLDKGERGRVSGGRGEAGRPSLTDNPHQFFSSLGVDLGHMADYGMSWWSKYMPWMTGAGLVGGASAEGEGPPLPMVCYFCGELFSNRDSLAMHVLFHTRDMPASVADAPLSTWRKPLPSFSSLPPSETTSPSSLLAMRQLHQRGPYGTTTNTNNHINTGGCGSDPSRRRLSPTEAAVASAAAAVMAAVTPPQSSASQTSLLKTAEQPDSSSSSTAIFNGSRSGGSSQARTELKSLEWAPDGKTKVSRRDPGHFNLTLPQRGASAPIPTRHATPTPPSSAKFGEKGQASPGGEEGCPGRTHSRPLSADHVVLRQSRPLLITFKPSDHLDVAPAAKDPTKNENSGSNGSLSALPHPHSHPQQQQQQQQQAPHSSAFNVYRLQRLKSLRLAKGVYRRPGARGRPPMTIYGTAGRRPMGGHGPALSPNIPLTPDTAPSAPSSSSPPSSSSSKVSSMVQALTSQGHAVSACSHCELVFGDRTLYQLHMGLHNVNNPWQCNACGCVCSNRLHFATHTLHY